MEDLLENYVGDNLLSKANILKYVDDYSIYSFYIKEELELNTKYSSPLRLGDDDPSFSMYYSKHKEDYLMFKDQSTGKFGNVFDFIYELMILEKPVRMKDVLLQINSDFGLGLNDTEKEAFVPHLIKSPPLKKDPVKINITIHEPETQEYIEYWEQLEITKPVRDKFYFRNPKAIHYHTDIHKVMVPRTLSISYEIVGHYKIYHPYEQKKYKFRNNYLDTFVEGALQLTYTSSFVIITKSMKECAFFFQHFGWEAVAGKSENTFIPPYFMENFLRQKYTYVYIWLDKDEAGINAQNRYLELYPWLIPVIMDDWVIQKDPTDFFLYCKQYDKRQEGLNYLQQLIHSKWT